MEYINILVFGAGAIGTYIGGSLAKAGNRVSFLEQPKGIQELQEKGLRLDFQNIKTRIQKKTYSSFTIPPSAVRCFSSLPAALEDSVYDVAVFALKSYDTSAALGQIKAVATQFPPIVCLSNGVDNEPELAAVLGTNKVIAGTVSSSIGRRGIGDIVLERLRGIGLERRHPISTRLAEVFNTAGLKAHLYRDASSMKWSKLLTNIMVNASSAILDLPPLEVLSHPGLFELEIRMLREALAVMEVQGIRVVDTPKTPVRLFSLVASLPPQLSHSLLIKAIGGGRGSKMPSFHIDLHSGRCESEVGWLNGAVVRYGEKYQIPTPVNQLLSDILSALTRGELPRDYFSHQPNKLLEKLP